MSAQAKGAASGGPSGDVTGRDQISSSVAPTGAAGAAADTDTGRSSARDTADGQALDSPAKAAAAAAADRKPAAAAGPVGPKGAAADSSSRSVRSVAEFAREVAALQEENKHLKQLLHNQVSNGSHHSRQSRD